MFSRLIHLNNNVSFLKLCYNHRDWNITYRLLVLTNKNNTTIDGQVISDGEVVVKAQNIFSMQENTNWYWKQQQLKQTIVVPKRTVLHPRLDVIIIRYVQDILKNFCNRIQEKNHTKTSYYYDWCWLWLYLGWNWASWKF